jgi:hypothetical protein
MPSQISFGEHEKQHPREHQCGQFQMSRYRRSAPSVGLGPARYHFASNFTPGSPPLVNSAPADFEGSADRPLSPIRQPVTIAFGLVDGRPTDAGCACKPSLRPSKQLAGGFDLRGGDCHLGVRRISSDGDGSASGATHWPALARLTAELLRSEMAALPDYDANHRSPSVRGRSSLSGRVGPLARSIHRRSLSEHSILPN